METHWGKTGSLSALHRDNAALMEDPGTGLTSGDALRQAPGQSKVAGVEPVMNVVQSSRIVAASSSTSPSDPAGGTPADAEADRWGISSPIRLRGPVLELAGRVKRKPVEVLLDSGLTGNFMLEQAA